MIADYGLSCSPALSVTTAPLMQHMQQLWRYMNEPDLPCFTCNFISNDKWWLICQDDVFIAQVVLCVTVQLGNHL